MSVFFLLHYIWRMQFIKTFINDSANKATHTICLTSKTKKKSRGRCFLNKNNYDIAVRCVSKRSLFIKVAN